MQHKTFELLETKADAETGTFTALVSVFNNVDKGNDRMLPGSFKNTLEKWRKSGRPLPVILSHQWDNLKAWVGRADPRAIYEDERGLVVQGQLDMEDDDARKVHRLMKDGLLTGWSFGYSVPAGGQKKDAKGVNNVSEVELFEVGPTLVGMNPEAQLQEVKSSSGKGEPHREVTKNCEECGTPFAKKRTESWDYWQTKRFCSMGCKGKEHSRQMRKGDLTSSGATFRQSARGYLENKCAICGWDEGSCDVAHIEPGVDALDNVIMLCPNHHRMFDRGLIPQDEIFGLKAGIFEPGTPRGAKWKAEWSAAFVNSLPDSSFLYIEPGGDKDSEGKTTPRSLRHFPVKGPDGSVDMPHLRNALSRIPQSNLPQSVKDRCTAAAQRMMNNTSSSEPEEKTAIDRDDGTHEEPSPAKSRSNALKERSLAASLEVLREGSILEKRSAPEPDPELDYWELKRRSQMAVLDVLSEGALHD